MDESMCRACREGRCARCTRCWHEQHHDWSDREMWAREAGPDELSAVEDRYYKTLIGEAA